MNKEEAIQTFNNIHKGLYFRDTKEILFTNTDKINLTNLFTLCINYRNKKEIILNTMDRKRFSDIKKKFKLTGLTFLTKRERFIYYYIIKIKPRTILNELEKFKTKEERKLNYGIFDSYKY